MTHDDGDGGSRACWSRCTVGYRVDLRRETAVVHRVGCDLSTARKTMFLKKAPPPPRALAPCPTAPIREHLLTFLCYRLGHPLRELQLQGYKNGAPRLQTRTCFLDRKTIKKILTPNPPHSFVFTAATTSRSFGVGKPMDVLNHTITGDHI